MKRIEDMSNEELCAELEFLLAETEPADCEAAPRLTLTWAEEEDICPFGDIDPFIARLELERADPEDASDPPIPYLDE